MEFPATFWRHPPKTAKEAKERLERLFTRAFGVSFDRAVINSVEDAQMTTYFQRKKALSRLQR